jgi:aryl-alcohol dehydrogenase-like predicted oxidoreductase
MPAPTYPGAMQYRTMGSSDLTVSALGFGCWEMGGNQYGEVDDDEERRAVQRAIDLGVTLFDTAAVYGYGHSEEVLGRALGRRRSEIVLVTKGGLTWEEVGGPITRSATREVLIAGLEDSLRRLGTDYVDLFLIHWPDGKTPEAEMMASLNEVLQSGKARYIGVSNFTADQLRASKAHADICANQVGYNLFDRRWERQMFPTARELGIGIMAYGPMAHGLLAGTFTVDTRFLDWDWRSRGKAFGQELFTPENFATNVAVADRLKEVAAQLGTSLPKLAIAWVLADPAVSTALSGTRTSAEIEHNVGALDVQLDQGALDQIDEIMSGAAGQVEATPV